MNLQDNKLYSFIIAFILLAMCSCVPRSHSIQKSTSASPEEVNFFELPKNSKNFKFLALRGYRMIVFEVEEAEFVHRFSKIKFEEILNPKPYYFNEVGKFVRLPYNRDAIAKSGLFYFKSYPNGEYIELIYDRDLKIGYFNDCDR